jgi:hypothetical protein
MTGGGLMGASTNAREPTRGKEVYPQHGGGEDPQERRGRVWSHRVRGYGRDDQATTHKGGEPYEGDVIQALLTGACCGATACTRMPLCQAGQMSQDQEHTTGVRPVVAWDRTNGEPHFSGGIDP